MAGDRPTNKRKPTRQSRASVREQLLSHLPLVLTGVLFGIVFIRLFTISHGNFQTSLAMLSVSGTVEVVFGTLLGLIPGLSQMLVYLASGALFLRLRAGTGQPYGLLILMAIGLATIALTAPQAAVLLVVISTAALIGALLFATQGYPLTGFKYNHVLMAAIIGVPFVLGFLQYDTPWLPIEDITLDSGKHQVGYVLGVEDGSLVVLTEDNRLIDRVRLSDVRSRQVCQQADLDRPLLRPWGDDQDYPDCPK